MIDNKLQTEVSYHYIGDRDYVHGTTIFESFLDLLLDSDWYKVSAARCVAITQLKFNSELRTDGRVTISRGEAARSHEDSPVAEMTCLAGDQRFRASVYKRDSHPVTQRLPDQDRGYVIHDLQVEGFSGECFLAGVQNHKHLVRGLIEANKQLHLRCLSGEGERDFKIRWIYMRNHVLEHLHELPDPVAVRFRHMGSKDDTTGRTYTLNQVEYSLGDLVTTFDLCFSYHKGHR